ncbi:MAG: hypothetical protein UV58_C0014G0035 [Candidatus Wolfebacteria bacterium GW2011_GWC1_43_10]|uniref:Uncharacterized protein n=1 Tax=Candidatus Wolfebacteria bacterium GW2011_GWC1_43_10 TaxID=1619011 RepID=A0A0G1C971_9BACT|nr:MAG: hypothetical protein UV58_C0014G0035 [Candidatus Wolfebacteria bacterium GW2011_GWC1_43_10]
MTLELLGVLVPRPALAGTAGDIVLSALAHGLDLGEVDNPVLAGGFDHQLLEGTTGVSLGSGLELGFGTLLQNHTGELFHLLDAFLKVSDELEDLSVRGPDDALASHLLHARGHLATEVQHLDRHAVTPLQGVASDFDPEVHGALVSIPQQTTSALREVRATLPTYFSRLCDGLGTVLVEVVLAGRPIEDELSFLGHSIPPLWYERAMFRTALSLVGCKTSTNKT